MVSASNISIASVISSAAMLTLFITSVFSISDKVVETENEVDQLTNQLALLETQIEDKKHENIITRIINAKSLLDSCDPVPENADELNHSLSNAIKLASLEKKFAEAESELNESVKYLKECEFFKVTSPSMATVAVGEDMISSMSSKSTMPLIQANKPQIHAIPAPNTTINEPQNQVLFLEIPNDIKLFTKNPDGEQIFYTALGIDFSEGRLIPICNPPPGIKFSVGETTVSCKIINSKGQELSKSFKITLSFQQ